MTDDDTMTYTSDVGLRQARRAARLAEVRAISGFLSTRLPTLPAPLPPAHVAGWDMARRAGE